MSIATNFMINKVRSHLLTEGLINKEIAKEKFNMSPSQFSNIIYCLRKTGLRIWRFPVKYENAGIKHRHLNYSVYSVIQIGTK